MCLYVIYFPVYVSVVVVRFRIPGSLPNKVCNSLILGGGLVSIRNLRISLYCPLGSLKNEACCPRNLLCSPPTTPSPRKISPKLLFSIPSETTIKSYVGPIYAVQDLVDLCIR